MVSERMRFHTSSTGNEIPDYRVLLTAVGDSSLLTLYSLPTAEAVLQKSLLQSLKSSYSGDYNNTII